MSDSRTNPAGLSINDVDTAALLAAKAEVTKAYQEFKDRGLQLDLTRGKPSAEQLDFSTELLSLPGEDFRTPSGVDTRNYGGGEGIAEIRQLWSEVLGVDPELTIAADASSLNIQFDLINWSYTFGNNDSQRPWSAEQGPLKWICPVPGYDRHHSITELFGFEMVTVPMTDQGPDMDAVRELVKDPAVKGMWAVPMFSNPTGVTFSRETAHALASMETAAPDFRVMWDNAYAVHTLTSEFPEIINVLDLAAEAGNPNRFWALSSTSKITFAGAGVAFFTSSKENLDWYNRIANVRGIGPNKVNQLAHFQFFKDVEGVRAHMRKHAGSLAPKFDRVIEILERRLGDFGVARWTTPEGGYFISVDVVDGTAARVVELAKQAGVALTAAGSTYPLKQDPNDRNLRLAPSMPDIEQVELAMDGFATCVLLAAIEAAEAAAETAE
ncbi:aminotransferase class I/II-fold pyridoxal phosphate-dependent enzyme [Corynebacterium sp. 320]|uniref:aminotransferase class I/II-fold pyridoxal phosphate-dependent enzyme n=1 Tax=Corynebacterium TaxID=1716 RepID=UPI00125CB6EB|nr:MULTISPECIES: aminotransferase class I/II-fold pyridoxal phosphate-dependent enzyme [Corynebacterium]KAB1502848.1 aminotransferase class I/II-fold pyridoxal phosphate-dependent enzyme [Corynebacterium sp. 320]KAB1552359.1 aminotransferase class I/II-fold pyridoxal phosphate-dependent enzyme [Corynebacterium sp. 321]KAB1554426.1 aminotransferase class I/II-fold pyridoxal phosphate-dependent enzyme [Corynebacterium sp. 319]KAB3526511.1 aminotransferase class I/II-fold pyridoxal phosphate-depen